jgi:hypothetical protein
MEDKEVESLRKEIELLKQQCKDYESRSDISEREVKSFTVQIQDDISSMQNKIKDNEMLLQQLKEEYAQMDFNSLKQNEEIILKQQQQLDDINKINNDLTNKLNVQQQQKMLLLDETYLCTNVQYWTPQAMYKYIQAYSEQKGNKTSE